VFYPANSHQPYILFLHGFPSSSYDWRRQFKYFSERGYGIIAPDLLGYGGTDHPSNIDAFRLKNMAEEIVDLLDCLDIDIVLGVAHDL
jgi:soluble epoxide hydrolase / lipid-phosphate phosphatase